MNLKEIEELDTQLIELQRLIEDNNKSLDLKGNKLTFSIDGYSTDVIINSPTLIKENYNYPAIINLHGGGFIAGAAPNIDSYCQMLADKLDVIVINLDYKLYPEVKYPYFTEELKRTLKYVRTNAKDLKINPNMIGACGFSAGGTIVFGTEVELIKGNDSFDFLIGIYPMVSGRPEDVEKDSLYPAVDDMMGKAMLLAMNGYENVDSCSALLADDSILEKFPYTLIVTCGKDSLGTMGRRFVDRLSENKCRVISKTYENAFHGFIEVNREDFNTPDSRKTDEQMSLTKAAEQYICDELLNLLKKEEGN